MKLSKVKLVAFFGVLVLLLWALYPRGMFLGYIYEGFSDLTRSERHYLDYLRKKPTSKFAIERLAALYERMGEPEKARPYFEALYAYRPRDEELARRYLDLLEDLHDAPALYHARLQVAHNLMTLPRPPLPTITALLNDAYQYAEWHQLTDDQYAILTDLVKVARNRKEYEWVMRHLDLNLKKTDKVLAALDTKLRENPADTDVLEELVAIYTLTGHLKEASALIAPRLETNPKDPALLQARMLISDKIKDFPQLIRDARTILELHVLSDEEEWETRATLAYAFLAAHHYIEALQAYEEILDHDRSDPDNWLNMASVLDAMGRYRELVAFLGDYLARFPGDAEREKLRMEIYLYRLKDLSQLPLYRRYISAHHDANMALDVANLMLDANQDASALQWLEDIHAVFPHNPDMVEMMAQIEAAAQNTTVAKSWYVLLADLRPDPATKLEVGRVLFFMGDAKLAEPYLQKVVAEDSAKSRLCRDAKQTRRVCGVEIKGEALAWLSEIHASIRRNQLAVREARDALAHGVTDHALARLMRLRVATANQEWWVAMPILEEMIAENPQDRYLPKDLRELHHEYDTRLTPTFNFTKYGGEYFSLWGMKFKDFITHRWELDADVSAGRFVSPSTPFTGWTETGRVLMTARHLRPWYFSLGIEGAGSGARTTATPLAAIEYKPTSDTGLKLSGAYRQLRQDFPQAVVFGTLMDSAQIEAQTLLWNRLVLSAKYSFECNRLPSGATATGNEIEPAAAVILFRKPYVTLGWQMDYQRLNSTGNFLASVPLIPYMDVQYVTGLVSGRPTPKLFLEGGFYNGHDFDRGLSILNGDLWGVRGMFEWAVFPWLDVVGSYEFGRQRVLDIPGYSNVVNFGLSGHW